MVAGYMVSGCGGAEVDVPIDKSVIDAAGDEAQLVWAVKTGDTGKVKNILDTYPDAINISGRKLLETAIQFEQLAVAKLLIERGVDVNQLTSEGKTFIEFARDGEGDPRDMVELLKSSGATE